MSDKKLGGIKGAVVFASGHQQGKPVGLYTSKVMFSNYREASNAASQILFPTHDVSTDQGKLELRYKLNHWVFDNYELDISRAEQLFKRCVDNNFTDEEQEQLFKRQLEQVFVLIGARTLMQPEFSGDLYAEIPEHNKHWIVIVTDEDVRYCHVNTHNYDWLVKIVSSEKLKFDPDIFSPSLYVGRKKKR